MKKNPYLGRFIAFEGLDGSGQSTQALLLQGFLARQGKNVLLTKEPTSNSSVAKEIRSVLSKKEQRNPLELQKLFAEDRKEHLEKDIIPALEKGSWIITDRYAFSSLAFGMADGAAFQEVLRLQDNFLIPDATFLLKVSPDICVERIIHRGEERTLFEEQERLQLVWNSYEKVIETFPEISVVNGEQSIEKVAQNIQDIIANRFHI